MSYTKAGESMRFETDGGHTVTNFVNTLDERPSTIQVERLAHYADLVSFVRQEGLIDDALARALAEQADLAESRHVHRAARRFRESLHRVLLAATSHQVPTDHDLRLLESVIRKAMTQRRLMVTASGAQWQWRDPHATDRPLLELAHATDDFLDTTDFSRVKQCAATDCGTLFVDHSKRSNRRWCSMASCGNREKVRRFRSTQPADD